MNATTKDVLERMLPMLVKLGNYIGNGDIDPRRPGSLGERCDLIDDIYTLLKGADSIELDDDNAA